MNNYKITAILLVVVFLFIRAVKKPRFSPVVLPLRVRNDDAGSGFFGASRSDHSHEGADFLADVGQPVYAPFGGVVWRIAYPYSDDARFLGVVVEAPEPLQFKIFYIDPAVSVGQIVQKGDLVGYAQNIAAKYGGNMKNHVHLEIRKNGKSVDPQKFF